MIRTWLSKYKRQLHWLHIVSVYGAVVAFPVTLSHLHDVTWAGVAAVFCIGVLGFSQNIGLLHEHFHRLPVGPSWCVQPIVLGLYHIGLLSFTKGKVAHLLHHAHLGTKLDPDRLGYLTTKTLWDRLRYLWLIGPLRATFAPVDIESALADDSLKLQRIESSAWRERVAQLIAHVTLVLLTGWYYLPLFASLLTANVLSNVREMAEHGNEGKAGLVNVRPGFLACLLFSNPGFWYHGTHHHNASIHYLDLPLQAVRPEMHRGIKLIHRKGYIRYLIFGNE